MFSFIKRLFTKQNIIVYIRFRNEKVYVSSYPVLKSHEDLPIIAVTKKGDSFRVSAVGEAVLHLPESDKSVVYTPFAPFSVEDGDFELAEKIIRYLLQTVLPKSLLLRPKIIIHPDKSYLSEMEEEAYRELALSAGAREVVVYVGKALEVDELERFFVEN